MLNRAIRQELNGIKGKHPTGCGFIMDFNTPEEMEYKIDLTRYPSFCKGKRAGEPFHQLVFHWKE